MRSARRTRPIRKCHHDNEAIVHESRIHYLLPMTLLKAVAIWLLILILAVLNGGLRETVLVPALGKPAALVLSGVLLGACIVIVALVLVPRFGRLRTAQALQLGLLWLVLTLVFEFGFGHWVQGHRWSELLEAYNFKDGNLWPLVLVVLFFAPLLASRFDAWRRGASQK
jgi:hypothetical protein